MADLPEIPDGAVQAIRLELPWLSEHDVDAAAQTAWVHLYAAALRHAADLMDCDRHHCATLRRLADEAGPPRV